MYVLYCCDLPLFAAVGVQVSSTREEEVFEIRIDGKLVCAKRRGKPGVFLHMETFVQVRLDPLYCCVPRLPGFDVQSYTAVVSAFALAKERIRGRKTHVKYPIDGSHGISLEVLCFPETAWAREN